MNKLLALSISSITAVFLATGCSHNQKTQHSEDSSHEVHWDYVGEYSPQHWGEMKKEFSLCSKGTMQTPINIVPTEDIDLIPLGLDYHTGSMNVVNNGHTVQVNIAKGSSVTINGKAYELKQFHFHTPSENNINGEKFALEGHFVHAAEDGSLAVVAVMFHEGEENRILSKIWEKFPLQLNHKVLLNLSADDINAILPANKDYYKFTGSLTTPPCTENVKWNVFKTSMSISKEQVKQFFDTFGHTNNRPIQATNNRTISQ